MGASRRRVWAIRIVGDVRRSGGRAALVFGVAAFTAARAEQEKIVQAHPDNAPAICLLGLIDAALAQIRRVDALDLERWRLPIWSAQGFHSLKTRPVKISAEREVYSQRND